MDLSFLDPTFLFSFMAPIPPLPQDDTLQRVGLLALAYVVHATAYCFEPSDKRDAAYLSVLTAIFARIWTLNSPSFVQQAFIASNTVTFALRTYANFLITHPDDTRRRNSDPKGWDVTEEESKWKRFRWGLSYLFNWRGVGWNYHVKGVQTIKGKPEYKTRAKFVTTKARSILFALAFQDVWDTYCGNQPFWKSMGQEEGYHSLAATGPEVNPWTVARSVMHSMGSLISSAIGIMIVYNVLGIMAVTTRISEPKDWPRLYGKLPEAYTVRKFWGRVWHQLFRDTFEPYTKTLARRFHFKAGTALSRYSQLYTAFALSTLIHYLQNRNLPYPKGLPKDKNTPGKGTDQVAFFLLQAVIIHAEDLVIAGWKKWRFQSTNKRVTRHMSEKEPANVYKYIGYAWTFTWLTLTARLLLDETVIGGGFEEIRPMPFSVSQWFLGNVEAGKIAFNKVGSSKPDIVW